MKLDLQDDQMCYVCGPKNAHGFKLSFEHPEPRVLKAKVVFSKEHQGFKNIVHGGMVGMLLDEMVVNLAWIEKTPAVTAQLNVRLKKAVPVGEMIFLEGRIKNIESKLIHGESTAKNAGGEVLAKAEVTCIRIEASHIPLAPTLKER